MDILGNALTLYDLGIRIATFINDLRHAQDDFLGLRAEADCLRICVNSLGSESCQDALYHYISIKQREDLELIIENTLLNMEDLNKFLGGCKYLVEKDAKKKAKRLRKRDRWKDFIKEAWATYKFAMTDPQPFRDKLALPTASINIFLTSMTHVGLANVGNLLSLSGHMPTAGGVAAGALPRLGGWEVIGQKIAFKRSKAIGGADLNVDLEDEVVRYVLHLLKGGTPFHAKESDSKTKVGRSKSITKDTGSGTYLVRRKTTYVPSSSRRTEFVETEALSPRDRTPLRLAAPMLPSSPSSPSSPRLLHTEISPSSPSSPRIVHAEPQFDSDDDNNRRRERVQSQESRIPRRQSAPAQQFEEAYTASSRTRSNRYSTAHTADVKSTRRQCRSLVEQQIKQEQEEAAAELRSRSTQMRSQRHSQMRPPDYAPEYNATQDYYPQAYAPPGSTPQGYAQPGYTRIFAEAKVGEQEDESDGEDVMELLEQEYGLKVERLYIKRHTVDNGTVAPVIPTSLVEPDEAEDAEAQARTIPPQRTRGSRLKTETSFYEGPRRTKPPRYHSSRYQPYDVPNREAYLRRRTTSSRYHPDHYEHDIIYDSDSLLSHEDRRYGKRSSFPDIVVMHHDEEEEEISKARRAKDRKSRLQRSELRRSVSDSATKHPAYIIHKRSQGAPHEDTDFYMHGARSENASRHSDEEHGSED